MGEKNDREFGWWEANRHWLMGPLVLLGLLGAIVLAVLLADFWRALRSTGDDQADVRNIGIVLIAVFGAGFAVWRGLIAEAQTRVARDQFERSQDRDYADLFTKAVEQLGTTREERSKDDEGNDVYTYKPNIEVRLGAIYALERISQDSERDHIAVMETLCAYVRENAPAAGCEVFEAEDGDFEAWLEAQAGPRADIQAVLTVLGRRGKERIAYEIGADEAKPRYRLDLRGACLRKTDMQEGDFRNGLFANTLMDDAHLGNANLEQANLWKADLRKAYLGSARLQQADLGKADMQKAYLSSANLQQAELKGANLQESYLWNVNLQEAYLGMVNLQHAFLGMANLQGADLEEAYLHKANLREANLQKAYLREVNLQEANLWNVNLREADLSKASLKSAMLASVRIDSMNASHVDFTNVERLSREALNSCFGCVGTVLPVDKKAWRPLHWHHERLEDSLERYKAYTAWKAARAAGERPPWVSEEDWTGW